MNIKISIISILLAQQLMAQSYEKIHSDAIMVDTHNDFLSKTIDYGYLFDADLKGKTHSDLARLKQGGVDVQLFSVFCDGDKKEPYAFANRQMDSLDAVLKRNPNKIVKVANSSQLYKAVKQNKIAAMFGIEGGHMIENDLDKLAYFYQRGARYMTLTWNNSTPWATSAYDETFNKKLTHKGLTDFGKQVVQKMNEMGMLVDVSHVGVQTFDDVLQTTTKPVIASHSSVYALCQHQRNLNDEQIKAIAKNGGVIQVNFFSGFLDNNYMKGEEAFIEKHSAENDSLIKTGMSADLSVAFLFDKYKSEVQPLRVPFSVLIDNIEYIIKLVGVDYVGLGSDFDGIESPPLQLDDVTKYPLITKALLEKGYSKQDLTKILGGNFLRVLKANEPK
ncbi:dipeptidase [Flavobacterium granuli]|uniref:Membrane dipeptidase n=1 Tax=Flavobacterium granuli TaxID=280093 RepID=A0ABU1RXY6_9FLAO|nr:dipeptidase [Flavobacterium granuli]MDR6843625.1 membrane dipeptidase [Flavobacterium granuli]